MFKVILCLLIQIPAFVFAETNLDAIRRLQRDGYDCSHMRSEIQCKGEGGTIYIPDKANGLFRGVNHDESEEAPRPHPATYEQQESDSSDWSGDA